jgi:hypothetical protein
MLTSQGKLWHETAQTISSMLPLNISSPVSSGLPGMLTTTKEKSRDVPRVQAYFAIFSRNYPVYCM